MRAEFFRDEYASWLRDVAIRVDEWVGDDRVMEHFRRMLRDWKLEHDARKPRGPNKRGRTIYNAVEILPLRRMTLTEKYALLAALHDVVCRKTKQINPWRSSTRNVTRLKSSISYHVARHRVDKVTEQDRGRIESALRDVEANVAKCSAPPANEVTAARGATLPASTNRLERPRRRRGRPSDTDSTADAKLKRDWQAAQASGTATIDEFARARGLKSDGVRAALERHRKRSKAPTPAE